jgi:hypothetical protein
VCLVVPRERGKTYHCVAISLRINSNNRNQNEHHHQHHAYTITTPINTPPRPTQHPPCRTNPNLDHNRNHHFANSNFDLCCSFLTRGSHLMSCNHLLYPSTMQLITTSLPSPTPHHQHTIAPHLDSFYTPTGVHFIPNPVVILSQPLLSELDRGIVGDGGEHPYDGDCTVSVDLGNDQGGFPGNKGLQRKTHLLLNPHI